jgi:hypothetical protein
MGDLIERSFMTLVLLTEDIEGVFHLCEPRSLPVDVLLVSFGVLNCSLPSQYGLLSCRSPSSSAAASSSSSSSASSSQSLIWT